MEPSELFNLLASKMPDVEYLFFKWTGHSDDWSGFIFLNGQNEEGVFDQEPEALDKDLRQELNEIDLFEEMDFEIRFTDGAWSEGVLLIALKPLTGTFEDDSIAYICQDKGFKGFALAGNNHVSNQADLDFNE